MKVVWSKSSILDSFIGYRKICLDAMCQWREGTVVSVSFSFLGFVFLQNIHGSSKTVSILFWFFVYSKLFPAGANIIFDGDEFICEDCDYSNQRINQRPSNTINKTDKNEKNNNSYFSPKSNDIDKHEYNPPLREEPPKRSQEPVYDYNPPPRQETPKRSQEPYHDYNPPRREEPPKRSQEPYHDYNPPLREEPPKRPQEPYHSNNPPLREEPPKRSQEAFHDYNPPLREEPPKRPQEPVHEERSRVVPPPYQQPAEAKQAIEQKPIASTRKASENVSSKLNRESAALNFSDLKIHNLLRYWFIFLLMTYFFF